MDRKQYLYVWLTGIFVAALILGDLIGGKYFRIGSNIDLSVGMLAFPLTFVLTDVLNEFYGAQATRKVTYVGLGCAVFAFTVLNIALAVPTSPESPLSNEVFTNVFGWSGRLYIASIVAYLVGQLLDILVFTALRRITKHRFLWLRATGSTLVSQAVDTLVVNFVFLSGKKPLEFILGVVGHSYATKIVIAIGMTPVIYAIHAFVLRVLKIGEPPQKSI